jgi:predicted phosphodiesterase
MKLGILSDIHGNDDALRVVLQEFQQRHISDLLFLGDLVGYYPFAAECVKLLAGFHVTGVLGNHDQVALQCLATGMRPAAAYSRSYGSALERTLAAGNTAVQSFLQGLPLRRSLVIAGRTLEMIHGSPWDALEGRVYPDFADWQRFNAISADVVLLGHTHYPIVRNEGNVLVLNPGSVGQARHRSGVACAAVLELPAMTATLIELPCECGRILANAHQHDPQLPYLTEVLTR